MGKRCNFAFGKRETLRFPMGQNTIELWPLSVFAVVQHIQNGECRAEALAPHGVFVAPLFLG